MADAAPVKIANAIGEEATELLFSLGRYLDSNDARVIRWNDELSKAMPAGRATAFLVMADVAHMTGDIVLTEKLLTRAETAGADPAWLIARRQGIYSNLGYASKALEQAKQLFSIRMQNIGMGIAITVGNGGFSFARDLLEQARLAKVSLDHVDQIDEIERIAEGTRDLGITDEQFARVLDIAGQLMRARGLLWLDRAPRLSFDDEMGCPGIRYRLEVTPEEAVDMDFEFIDQLIAADLDRIPLTVGFVGTLEPVAAEAT